MRAMEKTTESEGERDRYKNMVRGKERGKERRGGGERRKRWGARDREGKGEREREKWFSIFMTNCPLRKIFTYGKSMCVCVCASVCIFMLVCVYVCLCDYMRIHHLCSII